MKKIYLVLTVLFSIGLVNAQDETTGARNEEFKTIFGGKKIGGYGGIGVGYSEINSRRALLIDARGGLILGHWLGIGLAGSGFVNDYEYNTNLGRNTSLVGGYGGIFLEPILAPKYFVHLSFPVLFGAGGIAYTSFTKTENENEQQSSVENTQTYILIEPAVELEFNLVRFMRMSTYASYRWVSDLDWEESSPTALNGFTVGLRLKFGKF